MTQINQICSNQVFRAAGPTQFQTVPTQTKISFENKKDNFEKQNQGMSTTGKVLLGAGILASIVAACLYGPRGMFAIRNLGKKGIKEFMNGNADKPLKEAIQNISKNKEMASALDNMGVRNIEKIAQKVNKNDALRDLMTGKGKISILDLKDKTQSKLLVSFQNKKGYDLYKETKVADDLSTFLRNRSNCILGVHKGENIFQIVNDEKGKISGIDILFNEGGKEFVMSAKDVDKLKPSQIFEGVYDMGAEARTRLICDFLNAPNKKLAVKFWN